MTATTEYVRCEKKDIPSNVRFDTPRTNQGQIVETSYGGFGRGEHDEGAPFMRVHDRSLSSRAVEYYRLAKAGK